MKRLNLTLSDEEFDELIAAYSEFMLRFRNDPEKKGKIPPSMTGYAAGVLVWTIKQVYGEP